MEAKVFLQSAIQLASRCPEKQLGNWRLRVVEDINWGRKESKGLQCYLLWVLNWKNSLKVEERIKFPSHW